MEKKIAVVYYSFEGNVQWAAQQIAKLTGAAMIRINPEKEPPRSGPGKFLRGGASALIHEHPKLKELTDDPNAYDTILLCCPVWAGTYPPAVSSFIQEHPIKRKDLFFVGSSMSGKADKMFYALSMKLGDNQIRSTLSLINPLKNQGECLQKIREFCELNQLAES